MPEGKDKFIIVQQSKLTTLWDIPPLWFFKYRRTIHAAYKGRMMVNTMAMSIVAFSFENNLLFQLSKH